MLLVGKLTRNALFTGKGGVGKTSIACATALALADAGKRVLLVSTDPASNLDEVLATEIGIVPTQIAGTALMAMNVDPEKAAREYRERVVGPYRELLPEEALRSIEEQLSGACTIEIAAFDEFAKLLGDPGTTAEFDHIIFDTAPTGHTLRLLQLPAAWTDFIQANTFRHLLPRTVSRTCGTKRHVRPDCRCSSGQSKHDGLPCGPTREISSDGSRSDKSRT